MRKREVLRLKPGQRISWGPGTRMETIKRRGGEQYGKVVKVTPNGGVLIEPYSDGSAARWVPYHHVIDAL